MKRDEILIPGEYTSTPKALYKLPGRYFNSSLKVLLACLIDRLGVNDTCWPGLSTICKDTGLDRQTVADTIHLVEAFGFLRVDRTTQPNHYEIVGRFDCSKAGVVGRLDYLRQFLNSRQVRPRLVGRFGKIIGRYDQDQSAGTTSGSRQVRPELLKGTTESERPQLTTSGERPPCPPQAPQIEGVEYQQRNQLQPLTPSITPPPAAVVHSVVKQVARVAPTAHQQVVARKLCHILADLGVSAPAGAVATLIAAWHRQGHPLSEKTLSLLEKALRAAPPAPGWDWRGLFRRVSFGASGQTGPAWRALILAHDEITKRKSQEATTEALALWVVEAWREAGLNGVENAAGVVTAITPAIEQILRERKYTHDEFREVVRAAFVARKDEPFLQQRKFPIEWFFTRQKQSSGGLRKWHLEVAAAGGYDEYKSKGGIDLHVGVPHEDKPTTYF